MLQNFRIVFLVILGGLMLTAAQDSNALTAEEIQILTANGFNVITNEEEGTITYEHHGMPEYTSEWGWGNPNEARMVNHSYTVPLKSTVSDPKGCAGGLGIIGLAVNGAAFYNPYTAFGHDAVEGECAEELDSCRGHPSPDYTYHYHGVPGCLYNGYLKDKFLGVALDGYPIYGPMDSTGKNWTTADLDECHGHYYNGRYMYRATYEFPYIISCFHGESAKINRQPPNGQRPPPNDQGGQRPPPQRKRRHTSSHDISRRQVRVPEGMEDDKCWNADYPDWDSRICYVVCRNAGRDLDNCPKGDISATSNNVPALSTLTIACILYICFSELGV